MMVSDKLTDKEIEEIIQSLNLGITEEEYNESFAYLVRHS